MNRSTALAAALLTLAACSKDEKDPPPPPPPPQPVVVVETFQAGSTLLGQPDWGSVPPATNPCSAGSLELPYGGAGWDGTRLLLPDSFSGRLLAFDPLPGAEADPATAPAASWAIGQSNLTSCNTGESWTLGIPQAPSVSGGRLVVADSGLHQVLVYDELPADSGETASLVPFGAYLDPGCSGGQLNDPRGATLVDGKLVVADAGNHRVLIFDVTAPGAPLLVLGQVESTSIDPFDYCAPNDTDGDGLPGNSDPAGDAPSAATLSYPAGVWSDGTTLVVADTGNNRVLVWNAFPTASGQAADVVVGQSSATASAPGTGAARLSGPESVVSDGDQLFVADTGNHRVVVYPSIPSVDGEPATIVLGQGDFSTNHVAANDDDQDGVSDAAPSDRTLAGPTGVAVVDDGLAITDTGNGRVVIHRPPAP